MKRSRWTFVNSDKAYRRRTPEKAEKIAERGKMREGRPNANLQGLSRSPAPGTSINAARIQNESRFYGGGNTTIAGGLIHSNQGRKTRHLTAAGGANYLVLLDQEIHVVPRRTLAGQASQCTLQQWRQVLAGLPTYSSLIYSDRADLRHNYFN